MTDEQIKVLEAMRDNLSTAFADLPDREEVGGGLFNRIDALTAALEFIKDMREIEAAANKVTIKNRHYSSVSFYREERGWWPTSERPDRIYGSLREAYAAVNGGKD